MIEELVTYQVRDRIAEIALNRPHVLNALSDDHVIALREVVIRFDEDAGADVAILRGNGRAFCSGADIRQRHMKSQKEMKAHGVQRRGARAQEVFIGLNNWKPVIAAVHGWVVGAGIHIAFGCDLVVAETGTKFWIAEIRKGLDGTGHWSLLRYVGQCGIFANEVALTGRPWTAEEAATWGMVNRVAPPGQHVEEARALGDEIRQNPPLSVREVVRKRRRDLRRLDIERDASAPRDLFLTEDFKEATRAFIEKRAPRPFAGH